MNTVLVVICVVLLGNFDASYGCCNNCGYSSCCNTCQSQCPTTTCVVKCQKSCCYEKPITCAPTTSTPVTTKVTEPTTPSRIIESTTPMVANCCDSTSNNLTANINATNILHNVNTISINTNVSNNVINNISNKCCDGNQTSPNVTIIKIPVKVPVPLYNCTTTSTTPTTPTISTTPTITTTPKPDCCKPKAPPPAQNCCIIVIPCIQPCNPYHHTCRGCHGRYGYLPINPCGGGGCYRKPYWTRDSCTLGHCYSRDVDCSYCSNDFYSSYDGYSQCHGCFYN